MITNLLASIVVTLSTNVTDRFPTHTESAPCPEGRIGCLVYHCQLVPDENPDHKWVKTTVSRVTTVAFDLNGQHMEAKSEELVSDVEVEYAIERRQDLIPKGTNDVKGKTFIFGEWRGTFTNLVGTYYSAGVFMTNYVGQDITETVTNKPIKKGNL